MLSDGSVLIGVSAHSCELRLVIPRIAEWIRHVSLVGPPGVGKAVIMEAVFALLRAKRVPCQRVLRNDAEVDAATGGYHQNTRDRPPAPEARQRP